MRPKTSGPCRSVRRRGIVLVTMALTSVGVFGVVGLAVDVGRMVIAKNEIQIYSDSAAISAALLLDGTSTGISRAESAVAASTNQWNFGTASISNPSVSFATAVAGPWVASPNPAAGYTYAKVTATGSVKLYFLPLVTGQSASNVTSAAVAAQVPARSIGRGVAPYTAVSTNTTGPTFGLVAGNAYDLHWPTYNGNRAGCKVDVSKCFNSPPCSGDSNASLSAVVANWAGSYYGYWGSTSASVVRLK